MTGQSDCGDGLRVVPQQDRAREVIAEILTATGVLLTEVGFDALTTKEVAARAVINIATLYRYFPNKVALVRELEMQYEAECSERFATLMEDFATIEDWRAAVRRITRAKVEIRTAQPGMEGIRRAFPGSHEFRGLWGDSVEITEAVIADVLRRRQPTLSPRRAPVMARTVQVAADAVIMLRFGRLPPTQVAEQSAQIIIGYLAPVLDGPPDTQVNT